MGAVWEEFDGGRGVMEGLGGHGEQKSWEVGET